MSRNVELHHVAHDHIAHGHVAHGHVAHGHVAHGHVAHGHVTFAPGFADRVMARVAATPGFSDALHAVFLRLTPVALAAALLLAAVNLVSTRATNAPIVERVMGLSTPIGEVSGSTAMAPDVWGADLNSWGNRVDEN